jgi:outer membrane immunogenic protein
MTSSGSARFAPAPAIWFIRACCSTAPVVSPYGRIDTQFAGGIGGLAPGLVTPRTRVGWTVGGGVEGALDNNWSLKAEYLYVDYGRYGRNLGTFTSVGSVNTLNTPLTGLNTVVDTTTRVTGTGSSRITDHVFRVGINYRFAPAAVVARY